MKLRNVLFGLAGTLAVIAIVVGKIHGASPVDIYLHDLYFVVPAPSVVLFLLLLAAAGYYAVSRFPSHRFNHYLAVIGFAVVLLASAVFLIVSGSRYWYWPLRDWQVYSLMAGVFCLLLGGVLVSASVIWTLCSTLYRTFRGGVS